MTQDVPLTGTGLVLVPFSYHIMADDITRPLRRMLIALERSSKPDLPISSDKAGVKIFFLQINLFFRQLMIVITYITFSSTFWWFLLISSSYTNPWALRFFNSFGKEISLITEVLSRMNNFQRNLCFENHRDKILAEQIMNFKSGKFGTGDAFSEECNEDSPILGQDLGRTSLMKKLCHRFLDSSIHFDKSTKITFGISINIF
jgi:hypothetical protein